MDSNKIKMKAISLFLCVVFLLLWSFSMAQVNEKTRVPEFGISVQRFVDKGSGLLANKEDIYCYEIEGSYMGFRPLGKKQNKIPYIAAGFKQFNNMYDERYVAQYLTIGGGISIFATTGNKWHLEFPVDMRLNFGYRYLTEYFSTPPAYPRNYYRYSKFQLKTGFLMMHSFSKNLQAGISLKAGLTTGDGRTEDTYGNDILLGDIGVHGYLGLVVRFSL